MAARLLLGEEWDAASAGLGASKRRKVNEALIRSGLLDAETGRVLPEIFRAILEANPAERRQGIERFVDGKRIRQYPANLEERGALLSWVARGAFEPNEVLTEHEVNNRLLPYSEDIAVLRRYLVDYQLLERRTDGSEYALVEASPVIPVE
ncbi:DUF2087 domain-containing protein [Micrococcaceae bacterium RIT802]|nr:DUF2087 domain-containing protein [Micrococcaceae bacterium RIT 802]